MKNIVGNINYFSHLFLASNERISSDHGILVLWVSWASNSILNPLIQGKIEQNLCEIKCFSAEVNVTFGILEPMAKSLNSMLIADISFSCWFGGKKKHAKVVKSNWYLCAETRQLMLSVVLAVHSHAPWTRCSHPLKT